jgi:hypothetical protein
LKSILTIHNKGAQYHLLLPDTTPQKLTTMLWWAVEREGMVLVSDMGRLAMFIIEQACKIPGARLIGGKAVPKMIDEEVSAVFGIDRPERSLRLSMKSILVEDDKIQLMPVYDGAFSDFKKYLPTILANNT